MANRPDREEDRLMDMIVDFKPSIPSPNAKYTIRDYDWTDEDGKTYRSLRQIFVESEDPTWYSFSEVVGFKLTKKIRVSKALEKLIPEWEEELNLRLMSKGFKEVAKKVGDSYQAAKWLAEKGWSLDKSARGKRQKQAEQEKLAPEISDDMERVGLKLVKTD